MAGERPSKGSHYRRLFERLSSARQLHFDLEASWIAYSIIEDRANSSLRLGGKTPGRMLGRKLDKLQALISSERAFSQAFTDATFLSDLRAWAKRRNKLMHNLAAMVRPDPDLKTDATAVAMEGQALAKRFSAAVMRLKDRLQRLSKVVA